MTEAERIIHDQLVALENEGRLTPENVLELARDPRNPLHAFFTWDESAAEKYRLRQAKEEIESW